MSAAKSSSASKEQQLLAAGDNNSKDQQEEFIAAAAFTGSREGYAFTTGDKGTGYYKDVPLRIRTAAKAKPAVLKSTSLVKGLQRKPVTLPDPKKRKTESDSSSKPAYLKEMDKYHAMNCSANTQHDRPLVK